MNAKNIALLILNIALAAVFVFGGYKFWNAYEAEKRYNEAVKAERTRGTVAPTPQEVCVQVISYGKNVETGMCETFPTPCDVPEGWNACTPPVEAKKDGASVAAEEKKDEVKPQEIAPAPTAKEETPPPAVEKIAEGGKIFLYYFKGKLANDCVSTTKFERPLDTRYGDEVAALVTLLQPLTEEEKAQGYYTSIPSGTHLRKLTITKGVATADFNSALNSGGGSCSMTARRAQIENTLLQFPDIEKVVITVDGSEVGALQP